MVAEVEKIEKKKQGTNLIIRLDEASTYPGRKGKIDGCNNALAETVSQGAQVLSM